MDDEDVDAEGRYFDDLNTRDWKFEALIEEGSGGSWCSGVGMHRASEERDGGCWISGIEMHRADGERSQDCWSSEGGMHRAGEETGEEDKGVVDVIGHSRAMEG